MDTMSKYVVCIGAVAAASVMAGSALGTARVLEYDFAVNDSHSWSVSDTWRAQCAELSLDDTSNFTCTRTSTVSSHLGDGEYSFSVGMTDQELDGSPLTSGSDTAAMKEGRGLLTDAEDGSLLAPDLVSGHEDPGLGPDDQTGSFSASAVAEEDTWYQTVKVKPYGEASWQTVTITCELIEWTTMDGHNVGKIERTYTVPCCSYNWSAQTTTSGNISVTECWWFSYDEHVLVKATDSISGTLTVETNEAYPDDEYTVILTGSSTETLD